MGAVLSKIGSIAFVDDDANIRTLAQVGLEGLTDWNVHIADSGEALLSLVSQTQLDVILLDMMMPGLDGVATFRKLQQDMDARDIPVIFVTAKVQPSEVEQYLKLGVAGVIMKPFDPIELPGQVEAIFQKAQARQ